MPPEEIEEGRSQLLGELAALRAEYAGISFDEPAFMNNLKSLSDRNSELGGRIRRYNYLLVHHKLEPIDAHIAVDVQGEYTIYREYRERLSAVLGAGLADYADLSSSMDGLLADAQAETPQSECLSALCSRIQSYEKPLKYAKDLCMHSKYFDTNCTVGDYLERFEEDKIIGIIRLGRSDKEISDYLENACANVFASLAINKDGMAGTLEGLREVLSEEWSNYDIICKFNLHGLHLEMLEAAGERIARGEDILNLLCELQPDICSLGGISSKSMLGSGAAAYEDLRRAHRDIMARLQQFVPAGGSMASIAQTYASIADGLLNLQKTVCSLKKELKEYLDTQRNDAPRLFYISDEKIIRAINDHRYVKNVLVEIFNVQVVLETGGQITGAAALNEQIIFRYGIDLDQQLSKVVTAFHAEMSAYLRACFEAGTKGEIQLVNDLLLEYRYFAGLSRETNNTVDVLNRISASCPDALGLYTKPAYINNILHVGATPYMFEYYPPTSFIFTALTSRIFSSIILNFHRPGIILYGPSGTGKTETVRHFCRTVGRPLYTFCCSEHVEYSSIQNIITGCARLSSFVCFDEFNRLTSGVMSAVANCLYEHRDRVKVFLTMNVGYSGRHDLPRSLRALFGEVCVDRPDIGDIIQYHTGCYRLRDLLTALEERCSKAAHYDFGLRAVNGILGGGKAPGRLVDNLICFYMAVLLPEDKPVFARAVKEYYAVDIALDSEKYMHASLLGEALEKRNGVLLCGGSGMEAIEEYLAANNGAIAKGSIHIYNPTNMLLASRSIFGTRDRATGSGRTASL